ncbi:MAG: bifunctional riboflavin kinase/FAD synthetase [Ignavibacteriales bacterium]|nr:bifunctional riboflavin kinase/FAD synthetase [Ignavibacteriales bacterium]MCB9259557.1 bifunctional riboflavin kinase/FAD synthetase [Ignavibacteriales bacterium]
MEIITELDNYKISNSVVTIGTFDGIHVGHLEIINVLKAKAKELNLKSVVITFYPHPRTVLANNYDIRLLTPLDEKKKVFSNLNIDCLYIINFTKEFSNKTYKEFFDEIIVNKIKAKHLVIGYDHKFGKNRDGDINKLGEYIKENELTMSIVGPEQIDDEIISSTKIRNALLDGNIEGANLMLGRNYSLDGIVVEGSKRGRELGFPTANLGLADNNKLVPKNGVYFVKANVEGNNYFGVANVGLRPTFNNTTVPITEVFILDFNKDIYGKEIVLEFVKRIRDEIKFDSREILELQIKKDVETAKNFIKENYK